MSRYEYVKNIVAAYGLSVRVEPVGAKRFQRLAPVSNNEAALNTKLKECDFYMPRSLIRLQDHIGQFEKFKLSGQQK